MLPVVGAADTVELPPPKILPEVGATAKDENGDAVFDPNSLFVVATEAEPNEPNGEGVDTAKKLNVK